MEQQTDEALRVLCVDDDPQLLRALRRMLRSTFSIELANSGAEALEFIADGGLVDVVVTDMRMPGMTGAELSIALAKAHPELATIVLTGYADRADAESAKVAGGVYAVLRKPCPRATLVDVIRASVST